MQEEIVNLNDEWSLYSVIKINASIFVGWLENDDLLIVNIDGIFLYDTESKDTIKEDYETDFKKNLSTNNLHYSVKDRTETIDVFGLRGGGGNLLTIDDKWKLLIYIMVIKFQNLQIIEQNNQGFLNFKILIMRDICTVDFQKHKDIF